MLSGHHQQEQEMGILTVGRQVGGRVADELLAVVGGQIILALYLGIATVDAVASPDIDVCNAVGPVGGYYEPSVNTAVIPQPFTLLFPRIWEMKEEDLVMPEQGGRDILQASHKSWWMRYF